MFAPFLRPSVFSEGERRQTEQVAPGEGPEALGSGVKFDGGLCQVANAASGVREQARASEKIGYGFKFGAQLFEKFSPIVEFVGNDQHRTGVSVAGHAAEAEGSGILRRASNRRMFLRGKSPQRCSGAMSELKLRPPKRQVVVRCG
jgi:hypothetical protein